MRGTSLSPGRSTTKQSAARTEDAKPTRGGLSASPPKSRATGSGAPRARRAAPAPPRSAAPVAQQLPGAGRPGDEMTPPPDAQQKRDLAESAIERGLVNPIRLPTDYVNPQPGTRPVADDADLVEIDDDDDRPRGRP